MFSSIKKWGIGIAGSYAKEYITVDNITNWVVDITNTLLMKAMRNVDTEKLEKVCDVAKSVSGLCGRLSEALKDKQISIEEANEICDDITKIIGKSGITNEQIGATIDKIVLAAKDRV